MILRSEFSIETTTRQAEGAKHISTLMLPLDPDEVLDEISPRVIHAFSLHLIGRFIQDLGVQSYCCDLTVRSLPRTLKLKLSSRSCECIYGL
jgi:hypothetical protein